MLAIPALAAPVSTWRLALSEHFEIYAQSSAQRAAAILQNFEHLRTFFLAESGWKTAGARAVRVIVFASRDEYQPYQLRANADAYYVGSGDQDYIVMAGADPRDFGRTTFIAYAATCARSIVRETSPRSGSMPLERSSRWRFPIYSTFKCAMRRVISFAAHKPPCTWWSNTRGLRTRPQTASCEASVSSRE